MKTNLFTTILLSGELDFAHASCTDGLAQDPFARLGRDDSTRPALLGSRGPWRRRSIGVIVLRLLGSGSAASAIVGDGGRGRHVGLLIVVVMVVGSSAGASSMGPRGIGAPGRGRWAVAGASLGGVEGGGYVRGVVVILGGRLLVGDGASGGRGAAVMTRGDLMRGRCCCRCGFAACGVGDGVGVGVGLRV